MAMDFSAGAGMQSGSDVIPEGQLAWAVLEVRGVKASNAGGQYLDCELTIDDNQPFARRKVWEMIGDPFFPGNSEKYREMGMVAITRILEAGRGAGPNNRAGYALNDYRELNGLRVAVKIGIEKGKDGHQDKNRVRDWLTPNPASVSGHKGFQQLAAGEFDANVKKPTMAPATGGFGAPPAQQQAGFGFGNQGGSAVNSQAVNTSPNNVGGGQPGGFPQGQPQASTQWGNAGNAANGQPQPTGQQQPQANATNASSPSDPAQPPEWMQQANG